jgi:hypothetical protein
MQDKVSSTNLALKYKKSSEIRIWSAKPNYAKLDCSDSDQAEPNQGLYHQIMQGLCSSEILHSAE